MVIKRHSDEYNVSRTKDKRKEKVLSLMEGKDMKKYYEALKELNQKVHFKEANYFNMVFATGISKGVKFTEDRIRRILLSGVEEEFITYGQSLTLFEIYKSILIK